MQATTKLEALTGLRFFAAFAIVIHHLQGVIWLPKGVSSYFAFGAGVSFFFVLSGFILHYNYRDRIAAIAWPKFMWMRFWRLWPAHVAALGFAWYISPSGVEFMLARLSQIEITQIVFLLQSWTPEMRVYFGWNGPSWSISTELFFYATFPFLSVIAARNPLRAVGLVASVVAAYLVVAQLWLYDPEVRGIVHGLAGINPIARLLDFALGIALCEFVMFRTAPNRRAPAWLEWVAIGAVLVTLFAVPFISRALTYGSDLPPVVAHYLVIVSPAATFMFLIGVIARSDGPAARFLSMRPLIWLGETSFALYLVHQPAIYFFRKHLADFDVWRQVPLYFALVFGVSALIFYLVEKPGIYWSRRTLTRRKPTEPTVTRPFGSL